MDSPLSTENSTPAGLFLISLQEMCVTCPSALRPKSIEDFLLLLFYFVVPLKKLHPVPYLRLQQPFPQYDPDQSTAF